jgi:HPt (histidine-containing phosphotransfer) domain-containing protein
MKEFAVIDWEQVKRLRNDVGHEEFDEIIELFLEEVESIVEKLRGPPVIEELENDLHSLKGSAMNLGFKQFSELCFDGEKKASEGNTDEIDIVAITTSFDASKAKFLSEVSGAF